MTMLAKWFAGRVGRLGTEQRLALPPPSGVVLGETREGQAVSLPSFEGSTAATSVIMGASGAGKSVLAGHWLTSTILDDASDAAFVIVDPKADTILAVLQNLARERPEILSSGRIRYVNPFAGAFPFNVVKAPLGRVPADMRARQLALLTGLLTAQAGMKADGGIGARQLDILTAVYTVIFELAERHPTASLLWAGDALTPDGMKLLAREASTRLRETLTQKIPEDLMVACAARTRLAWSSFATLAASTSASSCLDFADLTAPGAITLIDLGDPLGGPEVRSFYASVLVRLIVDHLLSNRPSPFSGHHCQLVIEEAAQVATVLGDTAETLAQTGRSRRLGATVLLQGAQAIERAAPGLLETLVANAPTIIAGRLGSAADAERFSRNVAPPPGGATDTRAIQMRLAASLANLRPREFFALTAGERRKFRSADVDVAGGETALRRHAAEIAGLKSRYVLPTGAAVPTLREALGSFRAPGRPVLSEPEAQAEAAPVAEPRAAADSSTRPKASPKGRTKWG